MNMELYKQNNMAFSKEHIAFGSEKLIVSLNGRFVVHRKPYGICRNVA